MRAIGVVRFVVARAAFLATINVVILVLVHEIVREIAFVLRLVLHGGCFTSTKNDWLYAERGHALHRVPLPNRCSHTPHLRELALFLESMRLVCGDGSYDHETDPRYRFHFFAYSRRRRLNAVPLQIVWYANGNSDERPCSFSLQPNTVMS
jgi:hypothetical protein